MSWDMAPEAGVYWEKNTTWPKPLDLSSSEKRLILLPLHISWCVFSWFQREVGLCCFIKENTSGNSKGSKLLRKRGLRHLLAAVGTCAGLLCGSWCRLQQTGLEPRPRLHGPPKLPVPALPSRSISLPGTSSHPQSLMDECPDTALETFPQASLPSSQPWICREEDSTGCSCGQDAPHPPIPALPI